MPRRCRLCTESELQTNVCSQRLSCLLINIVKHNNAVDGTLGRNKIDDGDDEIEVVCKNKWISQLIPFKKYVYAGYQCMYSDLPVRSLSHMRNLILYSIS